MLTAKEFLEIWNKDVFGLINYDAKIVLSLQIPDDSKQFLLDAGLPESAPPFLDFVSADKGGLYSITDKFDFEGDKFKKYIYLGSTGSGDPVCMVENLGCIVYLDHDNNFKEIFINSSVPLFMESVVNYIKLMHETDEQNGEDAFFDDNIPETLLEKFILKLKEIDHPSLRGKCFWGDEIASLK